MVQYKIVGGNIIIDGNKTKNGKPVIACQTELYSVDTNATLDKTSTNEKGYYSFQFSVASLPTGRYVVRFYGSGLKSELPPNGDWETIDIISQNTDSLILDDATGGATISEGNVIVDVNKNEFATAILTLTGLNIKSGVLNEVEIHYQIPAFDGLVFTSLHSVAVAAASGSAVVQFNFPLRSKTLGHSFIFKLKNGAGVLGKYSDGSEAIITKTGIQFNGVADLAELYEVYQLEPVGVAENALVPSNFIKLKWVDYRTQPNSWFGTGVDVRNGYDGTIASLTWMMARRILGYSVFMYISDTNTPPAYLYPTTNPNWKLVAETTESSIEIRLPARKYVGFWVGFKMSKLQSQLPTTLHSVDS